jgi:hypothetical protein
MKLLFWHYDRFALNSILGHNPIEETRLNLSFLAEATAAPYYYLHCQKLENFVTEISLIEVQT